MTPPAEPEPPASAPVRSAVFCVRPWWRQPGPLIVGLALLVSFAAFGWTLDGYFLADDFGYVGKFHDYPFAKWPRLFVNDWSDGFWGFQLRELRPMTALTLMLDARCWGGNALGYRLTNLLLHAACAAMVGVIAWRVAGRVLLCGVAATVFFALHPVHAEPVLWITGRVDVVTTTFYLAGFIAFLRYRERGSTRSLVAIWLCYGAAAFSKEFGLTFPLMLLLADLAWRQTWRRWREWPTWTPYAGATAVFIVYYFCRSAAFTSGGVGVPLPSLTSAEFHTQFAQRQLTYVAHLFPPMQEWFNDTAPAFAQHAVRTFFLTAAVVAAIFIAWLWSPGQRTAETRRAGLFFGLGWYLVATLPLIITYISGRHLYLASAGVCIALALLLHGVLRHRLLFTAAALGFALIYVRRLPQTIAPWHDAGILSRDVSRALARVERDSVRGGALLLDVPEMVRGAYMWTWSVPFALRPPFTRERLDERLAVLEMPGLYFDWGQWKTQPAVAALQRVEQPGWLIRAGEDRVVRTLPVSAAKLRPAAEKFAKSPATPSTHHIWWTLVGEATAP